MHQAFSPAYNYGRAAQPGRGPSKPDELNRREQALPMKSILHQDGGDENQAGMVNGGVAATGQAAALQQDNARQRPVTSGPDNVAGNRRAATYRSWPGEPKGPFGRREESLRKDASVRVGRREKDAWTGGPKGSLADVRHLPRYYSPATGLEEAER